MIDDMLIGSFTEDPPVCRVGHSRTSADQGSPGFRRSGDAVESAARSSDAAFSPALRAPWAERRTAGAAWLAEGAA
ncbi:MULTISPECIES: hypothetical protein [unclassified Methylobacterium]|jgi:hypothetical protein|uniref:hypothetical protein n=1 Tax=unclassified Methylobacterium TaxID=2615210 RepID=UPI0013545C40|nr:hypothetical protein [Methylobacterium sp. 2A]MWV24979.1 hypothetical protein [Methylobacterium sp. 2A]